MTAKSIMTTDLMILPPDTTVAVALNMMCRNKVHNIPVVDRDGCFVGLFSLRRITHALLPVAAQLDDTSFPLDLGFVPDSADAFGERLTKIGHKPISELLEKKRKLRFCTPGTSIPKIFQLLSENPTSLPVVVLKGKHKTVVGMISTWDVLTEITATLTAQDAAVSRGIEEYSGDTDNTECGSDA